jgi:hypothetical protein
VLYGIISYCIEAKPPAFQYGYKIEKIDENIPEDATFKISK